MPPVYKDRGAIQAGEGDHAAGHVLVAADGNQAVEAFGRNGGLDGVRDHVSGDEAVTHALGAHGDAVGDGNGAEVDGFAAIGVDAIACVAGEVAEVHVAGSQVAWGAGNADLRLFEIGIFEANCASMERAGHGRHRRQRRR